MSDNTINLHERRNQQATTREQLRPRDVVATALEALDKHTFVATSVVVTLVGEIEGEPGAISMFGGPDSLEMSSALMGASQDILDAIITKQEDV